MQEDQDHAGKGRPLGLVWHVRAVGEALVYALFTLGGFCARDAHPGAVLDEVESRESALADTGSRTAGGGGGEFALARRAARQCAVQLLCLLRDYVLFTSARAVELHALAPPAQAAILSAVSADDASMRTAALQRAARKVISGNWFYKQPLLRVFQNKMTSSPCATAADMLESDKRAYADAALEAVVAAMDRYLTPSSQEGWRNEIACAFAALEEVSKAVEVYRARVGSGITPGAGVTASGAAVRTREDSHEDQRKAKKARLEQEGGSSGGKSSGRTPAASKTAKLHPTGTTPGYKGPKNKGFTVMIQGHSEVSECPFYAVVKVEQDGKVRSMDGDDLEVTCKKTLRKILKKSVKEGNTVVRFRQEQEGMQNLVHGNWLEEMLEKDEHLDEEGFAEEVHGFVDALKEKFEWVDNCEQTCCQRVDVYLYVDRCD